MPIFMLKLAILFSSLSPHSGLQDTKGDMTAYIYIPMYPTVYMAAGKAWATVQGLWLGLPIVGPALLVRSVKCYKRKRTTTAVRHKGNLFLTAQCRYLTLADNQGFCSENSENAASAWACIALSQHGRHSPPCFTHSTQELWSNTGKGHLKEIGGTRGKTRSQRGGKMTGRIAIFFCSGLCGRKCLT